MPNYSLQVDNRRYDPTALLASIEANAKEQEADHRAAEVAYGEMSAKANMLEKLANDVKGKDSEAYKTYMNYANSLRQSTDLLATQGLNPAVWRNIIQAKNDYSRMIHPIEEAYQAREKEAQRQAEYLKAHPDAIFERDAYQMGIDQWMKNPNYIARSIDKNALATRAAGSFSQFKKKLQDFVSQNGLDPNNTRSANLVKQWVKAGKVPWLYQALEKFGMNPDDVDKVMAGDPNYDNHILNKIIDSELRSSGVMNWDTNYDHYTDEQNRQNYANKLDEVRSAIIANTPYAIGEDKFDKYTDSISGQLAYNYAELEEQKRHNKELEAHARSGSGSGSKKIDANDATVIQSVIYNNGDESYDIETLNEDIENAKLNDFYNTLTDNKDVQDSLKGLGFTYNQIKDAYNDVKKDFDKSNTEFDFNNPIHVKQLIGYAWNHYLDDNDSYGIGHALDELGDTYVKWYDSLPKELKNDSIDSMGETFVVNKEKKNNAKKDYIKNLRNEYETLLEDIRRNPVGDSQNFERIKLLDKVFGKKDNKEVKTKTEENEPLKNMGYQGDENTPVGKDYWYSDKKNSYAISYPVGFTSSATDGEVAKTFNVGISNSLVRNASGKEVSILHLDDNGKDYLVEPKAIKGNGATKGPDGIAGYNSTNGKYEKRIQTVYMNPRYTDRLYIDYGDGKNYWIDPKESALNDKKTISKIIKLNNKIYQWKKDYYSRKNIPDEIKNDILGYVKHSPEVYQNAINNALSKGIKLDNNIKSDRYKAQIQDIMLNEGLNVIAEYLNHDGMNLVFENASWGYNGSSNHPDELMYTYLKDNFGTVLAKYLK